MLKGSVLALSAMSALAVPAAADAHRYGGYSNGYGYNQGYSYNQGYGYNSGYYPQQAYGYDNGYYGGRYAYSRHRCSGTTGTIVGAGAGALLGHEIGRGSYHQHSGTTGAILGAALGAIAGREVGKSTC